MVEVVVKKLIGEGMLGVGLMKFEGVGLKFYLVFK